jgi:hypothetical protein
MSGIDEYDRIHLTLATKNFVAHARVEGQDDPHGTKWALLGTTTLYDLSDEKLGSNSTLQIPLSAFKFLRITVDSAVKPSDVKNGTAGATHAQKAIWREVTSPSRLEQHGKETVITFDVPANTPVERLMLDIDSGAGERPWLYYGDEKLGAPEYDYAKLFQKNASVDALALDPEVNNAAYVPRPDDRPWTDQHPALLWTAILAAVVILGAIALRSLKTTAKPVS